MILRYILERVGEDFGVDPHRRPSSNCDPYTVIDVMVRTTCLDETGDIELEYR